MTEDRKYLFTDFHHILADGNSYDIIFEDIDRAYLGEKLEKESYTGFDAALDEEQQMKEENIRRPRNIMTVFSRELRQNPCLFLTAQERLLREDICRCLWTPESLWYFLPARSWGLLQTFCLQVYSAFS